MKTSEMLWNCFICLASLALVPTAVSQQLPLEPAAAAVGSKYRYRGPGFYRLVNYATPYAVGLNSSSEETTVVSAVQADNDDTQIWQVGEYSDDSSEFMIINKATGGTLVADRCRVFI
ncbi:MAG: hypothetical protein Q9222_007862 [Ikaeria aurantiellina]